MEAENQNSPTIHSVTSVDSPEFTRFTRALTHSSVIGLDAEWKPLRVYQPTFPTVSLLQIACLPAGNGDGESTVFLLDLLAIPLPSIYGLLKDAFVSPDVLKLGFRLKQDLVYLSSTFCSQGCDPGFDRVSFCFFFWGLFVTKRNRDYAIQDSRSLLTIGNEWSLV